MVEKATVVLRDRDANRLRKIYKSKLSQQSKKVKRKSTAELAESFQNKYDSADLSQIIGLLLADELDIQYDI